MKYILFIILFIGELFATPLWYHNLSSNELNTYIGYGSGKSENEAKQNALLDISGQISTVVKSEYKGDKKLIDGIYTKDITEQTSQKTNSSLSDYEVLKVENSDLWYVAIKYENRASIDKFIQKIKNTTPLLTNQKQNRFLANSSLAKELHEALGVDIDFKLVRKDKLWYLKYESILQPIDKRDFGKLFVSISNPNITLTTNKKNNILKDGESYKFLMSSATDGYCTLLDVYENGTVGVLAKNIKLSKSKQLQLPDEKSDELYEASLLEDGVETFDLYVAVLSPTKLLFDRFAMSDSELTEDERYKNFDELIDLLDGKEYTTLKVVTKAK